jgi:hypothetical protein
MNQEDTINKVQDLANNTHVNFSRHEAVCQERYEQLLASFERFDKRLDQMQQEVADLKTLATSGKVSLKTLIWIGSAVAALTTIGISFLNYLGK